MPLEILLVLVGGGIGGITLLLHLTGKSRQRVLTPGSARSEWARHAPDDTVTDVTLTHDGHVALIRTPAGVGLLWAFGADTVARPLQDFDWLDHPRGVRIQFHDFGAPGVVIRLDDLERKHWRHLLETA